MPVTAQGAINLTALIVPDVYVQIVPPSISYLNGVPSNLIGMVGTASWGPVGVPVIFGNMSDYVANFGPLQNRKYDMGTEIAKAVLQGANNFVGVRATDGTDTSATAANATNITFTAKYSGSLGNNLTVVTDVGSKVGTFKATVSLPGLVPEVFDNLASGLTGNAVWVAIANAINNGVVGARSASQLVTAAAGVGTAAPVTPSTLTFAGGADGAGVTSAQLIGSDVTPRKGLYALRATQASIVAIADMDDTTQFSVMASYGLSEGSYMVAATPAGTTIAGAATIRSSASVDTYAMKIMHGDWPTFTDTVNGLNRMVSPIGFVVGLLGNQSPEQSSLNKPLYGIVATQRSLTGTPYSGAELAQLAINGFDVITNPCPGGQYFGCRLGINSASLQSVREDSYTRLTNYIAYTISKGMGYAVGKPQTPQLRGDTKNILDAFLQAMLDFRQIGTADGSRAFKVTLDDTNNPFASVAKGNMRADIQVTYLSIVRNFIVNLEGGQTVKVATVN